MRRGLTLVELLIVIAIISLLLQMILPAIEASREAARKAQCKNNLRQIGLAMGLHDNTYQRFPSGGWMYRWVGEPERGTDIDQPGSWVFNLLSFVEEDELRRVGMRLSGTDREKAISQRCETPIPLFVCPSRRLARSYPMAITPFVGYPLLTDGSSGFRPERGARSDYAASVGDAKHMGLYVGKPYGLTPITLKEGDDPSFPWDKDERYTGVCFRHSRVMMSQIADGTSHTYLVGEKYIDSTHYKDGFDSGDNVNLFSAQGLDNYRTSSKPPYRDRDHVPHWMSFGSAHLDGFHMCFCDGSVRVVSYDIDPTTHRLLGNRSDGKVITGQEEFTH
jgi:prepilin-type N-terminal cleavage/methylation domain-containing protein